jgi:hypothetical protein
MKPTLDSLDESESPVIFSGAFASHRRFRQSQSERGSGLQGRLMKKSVSVCRHATAVGRCFWSTSIFENIGGKAPDATVAAMRR